MLKEIPREIYPKTFRGEVVWKLPFLKEYGCDIFTVDIQPKRYEYTFGNIKLKDLQAITIKSAGRVQLNDTLLHMMYDKYPLGYCKPYGLLLKLETEKLMFLLNNNLIEIPRDYHTMLIERNQHGEIMFLINTSVKLLYTAEIALIERGNDTEIEAYKAKGRELCCIARGLEEIRLSKK